MPDGRKAARHRRKKLGEHDRRHCNSRLGKRVLERFGRVLRGKKSSLILTHDNPDPDALASAAGMAFFYESIANVPSRLAYGGIIGRAENRALVRTLKLPVTPLGRLDLDEFDLLTLVDTQHPAGNHSLPEDRTPQVVIDHHPQRSGDHGVHLALVSDAYGATSSIVTEIIRFADLEPDPMLATALFYGVKSDTQSLVRRSTPADVEAYRWLFSRSDHALLAEIEHPKVPLSYFQAYHTAYQHARIYGSVIMVDLGTVYTPDIVPEIAERLLSLEQVNWSVAIGDYENELYVSVRTNDRRRNAGRQIQSLTRDLGGSAGGHGSMAGAKIPLTERSSEEVITLREKILSRFRGKLGVADETESTLI